MSRPKSTYSPEEWAIRQAVHRASSKRWREAHREQAAATTRKWVNEHREQHNATRKRWRQNHPEQCAAYRRDWREAHPDRVAESRRKWQEANRRRKALHATAHPLLGPHQAALNRDAMYVSARSVIPRHLPKHVQDDAIQAIVLAMCEGQIEVGDIPLGKVKTFVGAAWGLMDGRSHVSIDEVIPGTDNLRLGDTIDSERPHF